jgi:hypothetical protein
LGGLGFAWGCELHNIQGLRVGVWCLVVTVQDLLFGVRGSGFGVRGSGFGVAGWGC